MQGVVDNQLATENLMFCTDDKHVNDIFREGHISYNVQRAIDLRLEPLDAIKMATINAAKHFHLEHEIGSLTPGRFADVVLLKDLRKIKPEIVFKGGKIVSENGKSLPVSMKEYPDHLFNTVQLKDPITPERFQIAANGERARCKVIALIKDQIINDEIQAWLKIEDGFLAPDLENDILKMAVVERYGKNGNVSTALVRGFGLKSGAIASSVSHDHHNIVVVGTNDADMACAVNAVAEMQGGFAACSNGEKVAELGLPLAGLMSVLPAREVMAKMDQVNAAARALGSPLAAPFMTLSFVSLPTVPKLGLTDLGLVDVLSHKLTDLILETE
jgi:adenine deaminase